MANPSPFNVSSNCDSFRDPHTGYQKTPHPVQWTYSEICIRGWHVIYWNNWKKNIFVNWKI